MVFHADITPRNPEATATGLAQLALDKAMRMQTKKTAGVTLHGPDGSTILAGASAGDGGISKWVGDTTAPGMPTGISVDSSASMIMVSWDGSLEGGVPADFDHIQILVDGAEAGQLRVRGTAVLGPYEADSVHRVSARAWDDAHAEDGSPAPNGSASTAPVSVTVRSVVDASQVKQAQDKALEALDKASKAQATADGKNRIIASAAEPAHGGLAVGDLWMQLDQADQVSGIQVWNGSSFQDYVLLAQQVLVAGSVGTISMADGAVTADKVTASEALLEKLLVRRIKADEIDVGTLAAAIVKSGSFFTSDGLVGFDLSGFWAKDQQGRILFRASQDGVQTVGGVQTASRGDRIQLSQTLIQGSMTGGLQGIGDDPETPYWLIWGDHDEGGTASRLMMGTSTQQPEIAITRDKQGRNAVGLTSNKLNISGSAVSVDAGTVLVQGIAVGFADYDTASVMTFYDNVVDYRGFMRLYKRAGVFFLDFNVQGRDGAFFAQGQLVPCVALSRDVMPSSAIDVWAYGGYGALVRVHVFGPGEAQPQGTISVTAKDRSTDYVSGQLHWAQ